MRVISSNEVKTRKKHKCWGCGRNFPEGTEMKTTTSEDLGKIKTVYWCETCALFYTELNENIGISFGEFQGVASWEKLRKEIEEGD